MGLTLLFFAFFFLYVTLDAFSKHSEYGFIALVTYLHPFQFLDQHMGNMVLLQLCGPIHYRNFRKRGEPVSTTSPQWRYLANVLFIACANPPVF